MITRIDDDEIEDEDLRPIKPIPPLTPPIGTEEITELFLTFGGDPANLGDAASIASAGLVIAQQIAELTTAVNLLTFMTCKD